MQDYSNSKKTPESVPLYSDVNFDVDTTARPLVFNEDSIKQNILSILDTPLGSRWFKPTLGSNIDGYLFEPVDDITSQLIETEMKQALVRNGEGRIKLEVIVEPDRANQQFYVEIEAVNTLTGEQFSFNFNLAKEV